MQGFFWLLQLWQSSDPLPLFGFPDDNSSLHTSGRWSDPQNSEGRPFSILCHGFLSFVFQSLPGISRTARGLIPPLVKMKSIALSSTALFFSFLYLVKEGSSFATAL